MASYYPVFLDLTGRSCVVIGGGHVAETKVRQLLENDCQITVVSPQVTGSIQRWVNQNKITWYEREYQTGDLKTAFLAIAATNHVSINEGIAKEATKERVLLNVVDQAPLCGFIAPSVIRKGCVTIAISTGGASPALARKLRELLEDSSILDYADLAPLLSKARQEIKALGLQISPERWQKHITAELIPMIHEMAEADVLRILLSSLVDEDEPQCDLLL